jgi:hypothetical protein
LKPTQANSSQDPISKKTHHKKKKKKKKRLVEGLKALSSNRRAKKKKKRKKERNYEILQYKRYGYKTQGKSKMTKVL